MSSEDDNSQPWYLAAHHHRFAIQFHDRGLLIVLIVFFTVLLLAFLFLSIRVFRHRTSSSPLLPRTSTAAAAAATATPRLQPRLTPGLDAATIKSLPLFVHRSPSEEHSDASSSVVFKESECSICLGSFEDEEMVKVLPDCSHAYHPECVDKWLATRSSCPLCRSSLDSSSAAK